MTFPTPKMSLLLALPVVAVAALMMAAPLRAQSPPARTDPETRKAEDAAEQTADTQAGARAGARVEQGTAQDAERRKPRRDGERKPLPQREREEEDDRR